MWNLVHTDKQTVSHHAASAEPVIKGSCCRHITAVTSHHRRSVLPASTVRVSGEYWYSIYPIPVSFKPKLLCMFYVCDSHKTSFRCLEFVTGCLHYCELCFHFLENRINQSIINQQTYQTGKLQGGRPGQPYGQLSADLAPLEQISEQQQLVMTSSAVHSHQHHHHHRLHTCHCPPAPVHPRALIPRQTLLHPCKTRLPV